MAYPNADDTERSLAHLHVRLGAGYDHVVPGGARSSSSSGSGDNAQASPTMSSTPHDSDGGSDDEETNEEEDMEAQQRQRSAAAAASTAALGLSFGNLPARLLALDDRTGACAATIALQGGAWRVTANQQFADLFCPAPDLSARSLSSALPVPFIYAAFVSPEDRVDFLEALTRYLFGRRPPLELSQLVRMRDCFDSPFLAVTRLRCLVLAGGAYFATAFNVAPAPSSKYIRGGNREELGPSWMGLNFAEARFRTRQPSAPLCDLRGERFVADTTAAEPVREFFTVMGGGKAVLGAAVVRYREGEGKGAALWGDGCGEKEGAGAAVAAAAGMIGMKRPRSPDASVAEAEEEEEGWRGAAAVAVPKEGGSSGSGGGGSGGGGCCKEASAASGAGC